MKSKAYTERNEAREERKRQMLAAGLMAERFPGVESIVVTMNYNRGRHSAILRTLNFNPASHAFFMVSSLGEEDDGELDLTNFIHRMIRSRERSGKGEFSNARAEVPAIHANVDYEVAITYA